MERRFTTFRNCPVPDKVFEKCPTCKKISGNEIPFHYFFLYNLFTGIRVSVTIVFSLYNMLYAIQHFKSTAAFHRSISEEVILQMKSGVVILPKKVGGSLFFFF